MHLRHTRFISVAAALFAIAPLIAENSGGTESCAFTRGTGTVKFPDFTVNTLAIILGQDHKAEPKVTPKDFHIDYTKEDAKNDQCEATYETHGKVKFLGTVFATTGYSSAFGSGKVRALAYSVGTVDGAQATSPDGASSVFEDSDAKITIEISKDPKLTIEITPKSGGGPDIHGITGLAEVKKTGDHHPHAPLSIIASVVIRGNSECSSESVDGLADAFSHLTASNATETPILFNPK